MASHHRWGRAISVSGCLALLPVLAACGSSPRYEEPDPEVVSRLQAVDVFDEIVDATPIVDVHTHTFNARYLPLRGIAEGKRDANWLLGLVPTSVARAIADSIQEKARLRDIGQGPSAEGPRSMEDALDDASSEQGENAQDLRSEPSVQRLTAIADGTAAPRTGDVETELTELMSELGLDGPESFLKLLMLEDGQHRHRYRRAFGARPKLIVSHLMDLGPSYNQEADDKRRFLSVEEQIRRAEFFQQQGPEQGEPQTYPSEQHPDGGPGQIYFVAYNPFRDHWPDEQKDRALDIVKKAVLEHHAYGVKVYPPSGYRAARNEPFPDKPWSMFTSAPRKQWEARYGKLKDADELDERLDRLFTWCVHENVPVFTHCNTGEFQARDGYGERMADPRFWETVLKKHSELRLCFGHAGGTAFWFGDCEKEFKDWGETVYRLCTTYPNVYCEIGIHDAIVDPKAQANFVATLERLFAESPGDNKFQKKIMFGTDWYMPIGASPMAYLRGYRRALLTLGREAYVDFFCRNALHYLDVNERLGMDGARALPESIRTTLGFIENELKYAVTLLPDSADTSR